MVLEMLLVYSLLCLIISFLSTYLVTQKYIKYAKEHGILTHDAHKPGKPLVANRGGLSFLVLPPIIITTSLILDYVANLRLLKDAIALSISFLIIAFVGYLDDTRDLGLVKVPLMLLGGLPFIILGTYVPRPIIPFIGAARLTIVYPLGILLTYLVIPNAFNMIDVQNGVMCSAAISVLTALVFWSLILSRPEAILLSIILGGIIGFFLLNMYPAKVLPGNIGSYGVGALITGAIILSRLEYVALIALLPVILHGFYLLRSIGGLMTKEKISEKMGRPVYVDENGVIHPMPYSNAPFSLTRMFVVIYGPMPESEIVKKYYSMFAFSCFLAILTGFFML